MFINDIFNDKNKELNEVSNELLGRYKKAAGADASAADKRGDIEQGNKRFKGIVKATSKQLDNDVKKHKKDVNEDAIDDRLTAQYNTPQMKAQGQAIDQAFASGNQADFDKLGIMSPQQIERDYQAMRAKEPAQDAAVMANPKLTPGARTAPATNPRGVPIKSATMYEQDMAEGITDSDDFWNAAMGRQNPMADPKANALGASLRRVADARNKADSLISHVKNIGRGGGGSGGVGVSDPRDMQLGADLDPKTMMQKNQNKDLKEYGDTAKGQKQLTKVHKRAVDRVVSKQADKDPAYARKNQQTANRAWERFTDIDEAGPFGYGAKKPRKGSVAYLAAQKRKEQERGRQPIEPRDQMVGVAKILPKDVAEGAGRSFLELVDDFLVDYTGSQSGDTYSWTDGKKVIEVEMDPADSGTVYWALGIAGRAGKTNWVESGSDGARDALRVIKNFAKNALPEGVSEGSVQDKLHKRHQELRKKSGLPDPDYYKELKATYDLPDEERYAKAAELKKKYQVKEARKQEVNFDIEDIKNLERIRDLPTLRAQALALISKPSERPMKPEKVAWFNAALDRMDSPLKIIKLMYDLLLSGEGHAVIGSKNSMKANTYRDRFGESSITNEDIEKYVEELERAGYEVLHEKKIKQRLDPKCWKGYRKAGTKMKGDVRVNNCVPIKKKVDEYGAANGPPNLNKSDIKRMMPPEPVAEQIPTISDPNPREQPHPADQAIGALRTIKKLAGIDRDDVQNAVNQEITNVVRSPQDSSSKNVSIINRLFGRD